MAEKEQRGLTVPYLEAWRKYFALTQRELAEKAQVGRSSVIRAEAGESISYTNVRNLAAALGISVPQLLHEQPNHQKINDEDSQ
jgi:transcriptional regulator with XRE-family HTH domain